VPSRRTCHQPTVARNEGPHVGGPEVWIGNGSGVNQGDPVRIVRSHRSPSGSPSVEHPLPRRADSRVALVLMTASSVRGVERKRVRTASARVLILLIVVGTGALIMTWNSDDQRVVGLGVSVFTATLIGGMLLWLERRLLVRERTREAILAVLGDRLEPLLRDVAELARRLDRVGSRYGAGSAGAEEARRAALETAVLAGVELNDPSGAGFRIAERFESGLRPPRALSSAQQTLDGLEATLKEIAATDPARAAMDLVDRDFFSKLEDVRLTIEKLEAT